MAQVRVKSMAGMVGRVDFTPEEYARLIDQKGYRARWEKATFCPVRSPHDPLQHDVNHTVCDQGFLYYDPTDLRVLITGISTRQQYTVSSRIDPGQAMATVKSDFRISFLDKLTLLDSTMRFAELVTRSSVGVTDQLKYDVVEVFDLRDSVRSYVEGTDFQVSEDAKIEWIGTGQSPAAGGMYTISYAHHPVYLVTDMVHDIRDTMLMRKESWPRTAETFQKMPNQALVRLHFLVRDQSLLPGT